MWIIRRACIVMPAVGLPACRGFMYSFIANLPPHEHNEGGLLAHHHNFKIDGNFQLFLCGWIPSDLAFSCETLSPPFSCGQFLVTDQHWLSAPVQAGEGRQGPVNEDDLKERGIYIPLLNSHWTFQNSQKHQI